MAATSTAKVVPMVPQTARYHVLCLAALTPCVARWPRLHTAAPTVLRHTTLSLPKTLALSAQPHAPHAGCA